MRTIVLVAALLAAAAAPVSAASRYHRHCPTPAAREAEQAIRFMTEVMVASSACRDTVYAEFRLRNRLAIIGYQREMIRQLHGQPAFDRWDTHLANEASLLQNGVPTAQLCQQVAPMLKEASLLDPQGLHNLAVAKVASLRSADTTCRR